MNTTKSILVDLVKRKMKLVRKLKSVQHQINQTSDLMEELQLRQTALQKQINDINTSIDHLADGDLDDAEIQEDDQTVILPGQTSLVPGLTLTPTTNNGR